MRSKSLEAESFVRTAGEDTLERDGLDDVLESFAPTQPDWEIPTPQVKKSAPLLAELAVMSVVGLLGLGLLELISRKGDDAPVRSKNG